MMTRTVQRYLVCHLRPGMVLAGAAVVPGKKAVLLAENTVLSQKLIDYLISSGCQAVDIALMGQDDIADMEERQKFQNSYSLMMDSLQNTFDTIRSSRDIPVPQIKTLASQSYELLCYRDVLRLLQTSAKHDDLLLSHSLNVAIIAGGLAQWLGLSKEETTEAIIAGILHDIGKVMIPDRIINKPGKLMPYEMNVMRCHPYYSFQMVESSPNISAAIKSAILQHHERLDGSGYPDRLSGEDVTPLAQLVAVADIYEAMTSHLVYRRAMSPLAAIEEFLEAMFGKLNPDACLTLTNRLKSLMIGNGVLLDNGQSAKIIHFEQDFGCRPLVRLNDGQYVDLGRDYTLQIVKVDGF
ncbi:MAG: HD-GYP domain-containing protein [Negativicutes bacterium]|nr:HD-GYP domain-containing protein [Negativicutes bacterium]